MAHELSYTIIDDKGDTAKNTMYLPEGLTVAQYEEFADTLIDNIINMLLGGVLKAQLCIKVPISSIDQTGKPTATSDVENVGEFVFESASGFRSVINIPGYDESEVFAGSDVIDEAQAGASGFISAIVTGVTLTDTVTVVSPVDVGGDDLTRLITARERFRNSGPRR